MVGENRRPAGKDRGEEPGESGNPRSRHDVVLVSMPFASPLWPSVGLGLLNAILVDSGIPTSIEYFNLDFLAEHGQWIFTLTEDNADTLMGEWLFREQLFSDQPRPADEGAFLVDELLSGRAVSQEDITRLLALRETTGTFVTACTERIITQQPGVVGFTVGLHQHVASLAVAREVKRRLPDVFVLLGGPGCDGPIGRETLERFSFVDAVVSGEAENVIVDVVQLAFDGQTEQMAELTGVSVQGRPAAHQDGAEYACAPVVTDMDSLPVPDHADYFDRYHSLDLPQRPFLTFETSRGCWWGERRQCRFCSQNRQTQTFRMKSPERVYNELRQQTDRHDVYWLAATDSILHRRMLRELMPRLAATSQRYEVFFEVRPDLAKADLRLLAEAGVKTLQAGIESFSDSILALMDKGTRAIEHLQFLKWCRVLGLRVFWNLLYGMPGEDPTEYEQMMALFPRLTHLEPPAYVNPVSLHRFSPLYDERERLFRSTAPAAAFRHIYPFPEESLANLAFFFDVTYHPSGDPSGYAPALRGAVDRWKDDQGTSTLVYAEVEHEVVVWDTRSGARYPCVVCRGDAFTLFKACETTVSTTRLEDTWRAAVGEVREGGFSDALAPLLDTGIVVTDGRSYLNLALPMAEYEPSDAVLEVIRTRLASTGDDGAGVLRIGR